MAATGAGGQLVAVGEEENQQADHGQRHHDRHQRRPWTYPPTDGLGPR